MISSTRAKTDGGLVRPSALAGFRLMTNSNRSACSTGKGRDTTEPGGHVPRDLSCPVGKTNPVIFARLSFTSRGLRIRSLYPRALTLHRRVGISLARWVSQREDSMIIPHDLLNDLRSSPELSARHGRVMDRGIRFVVALLGLGLVVAGALLWVPTAEAQGEPILSFEGRVTSVSPREMLVAAEREGVIIDVVMVDLVRIPQSETRQIAQDDIVVVIGFIRRPGHKVIA